MLGRATAAAETAAEVHELRVVPRRSLVTWALAGVAVLLCLAVTWTIVTSPSIDWSVTRSYLFNPQILHGVRVTILLSVLAMAFGVVLGVVVGLARMSKSAVLRGLATGYIMLFRGVPVLVQLLLWGNIGLIIQRVSLGIPFTDVEFFAVSTNRLIGPFTAAVIGLALHEAAYMAEVVRSGVMSVDRGQLEAAAALGMKPARTTRRILMPQALRVIVPPTGNQFVTLIKGTSLVSVIAGGDVLTQAQNIAASNYRVIELLGVATFWYVLLVAVASLGQSALERAVSKGVRR